MIRVAIVDDHPAVRLGVESLLSSEPGLVPAGSAAGPDGVAPLLYRARPDVLLLDVHLPGRDGLSICRAVKAEVPAPAVLLYTAYADGGLAVPAIVAGADGIVTKDAPSRQLVEAIRVVAAGRRSFPSVSPAELRAAGTALDPDDLPILGMLVNRIPRAEIADALGLSGERLGRRLAAMLGRMTARVALE
jgi:DNA-binding NarL/FixJ family response regulator